MSLPLQTDRLVLRTFREDDYDALYAIQSRDDVGRYLPWGARDEGAVREAIELVYATRQREWRTGSRGV